MTRTANKQTTNAGKMTAPLIVEASAVPPNDPAHLPRRRRGNDLVRRYLWMAALSACQHNPAVRALYARLVRKHPQHKAIAIGHAMRKLLHLAFAIWKTGKPFDPAHYPWQTPAHVAQESGARRKESGIGAQESAAADVSDMPVPLNEPAAGHNPVEPELPVVTAAGSITSTPAPQGRRHRPVGQCQWHVTPRCRPRPGANLLPRTRAQHRSEKRPRLRTVDIVLSVHPRSTPARFHCAPARTLSTVSTVRHHLDGA
jgi:hypothetical protein